MGVERDREIRRHRRRRDKTQWLKARIASAADPKLKAKLIDKLKRANPNLRDLPQ